LYWIHRIESLVLYECLNDVLSFYTIFSIINVLGHLCSVVKIIMMVILIYHLQHPTTCKADKVRQHKARKCDFLWFHQGLCSLVVTHTHRVKCYVKILVLLYWLQIKLVTLRFCFVNTVGNKYIIIKLGLNLIVLIVWSSNSVY